MARVTVEDCIVKIKNRFELVLLAAHRARALHNGEESSIPRDNDKAPVVALREIAEESIEVSELKEDVIKSFQLYYEDEDEGEENQISTNKEKEDILVENDLENKKEDILVENDLENKKEDISQDTEIEEIEKDQDLNLNINNEENNINDTEATESKE